MRVRGEEKARTSPLGPPADLDLENALPTMAGDLDLERYPVYAFWHGYLGAELACSFGGFVDVEGPPDVPEITTART